MGVLVIQQEGEKLIAIAPGGDRVELVPTPSVDKYNVQPAGGELRFERDAAGRISGIAVTLPNGQEVKAKRSQ